MKIIIAFVMLVFLVGCATAPVKFRYIHPTKSPDQLERDRYDCKMIVTQYLTNEYGDDWFSKSLYYKDEMNDCLEKKYGWQREIVSNQ